MAIQNVRNKVPTEVEIAAHRFASACKYSGWDKCVVLTCGDGAVDMLTHSSSEAHTYVFRGGEWFEYVKLEEGEADGD